MAQMLCGTTPEAVRDEIAAWLEWIGRGQQRTFKDVAAELRTIPRAPVDVSSSPAGHIPGPYIFDPDESAIESEIGVRVATIPTVDDFPCRDVEKDEEFAAELSATGCLLAAAPDLLPPAKIGLASHESEWLKILNNRPNLSDAAYARLKADPIVVKLHAEIAAARAAISKAEGRSK